jgi:hypothetical protein
VARERVVANVQRDLLRREIQELQVVVMRAPEFCVIDV